MLSCSQRRLNSSLTCLHILPTLLSSPLNFRQLSNTNQISVRKSSILSYWLLLIFNFIVPKSIGVYITLKQSGMQSFSGSTGSWKIQAQLSFQRPLIKRLAALSHDSQKGEVSGIFGSQRLSRVLASCQYLAISGNYCSNLSSSSSVSYSY